MRTAAAAHLMNEPRPDTDSLLQLMDEAGVLVLVLDARGQVLRFNHALEIVTGWHHADAEGKDWFEHFIPDAESARLRETCLEAALADGPVAYTGALLRRDGSEVTVEWLHSNLADDEGLRLGVLCIGRDVSDLENARAALRASEELNRGILATAVNAIITINERGIIETVNPAAGRMFGYTSEEMIGKNVSLLMPTPYKEQHDNYLSNYRRSGNAKVIGLGREVVAQRKDGTVFPVDLSVGEVKLPHGRVFTGIIRDISARKRLEQEMLEISEKEQQRIGQDIHDDLCQQLAAIGCLAKVVHQRLEGGGLTEDAQSMADIVRLISQANTRAREMSRGLVPVFIGAGGLASALADLAASSEKIFRVSCSFVSDGQVRLKDNHAALQLYRIAQEALANAIKHSGADHVEITLKVKARNILLSICDNGVGFPDETPHSSGAGMGLLTMSHRAKMLGGHLTIGPGEAGGTEVRCVAPLPATNPKK